MLLILGDEGLDLGEFPDLVSDGLGVGPGECRPAVAAGVRHAGDDSGAVFDGNEGSLVFGVAGLPTVGPLGLGLGSYGLGVRMFGGGRLGRVGGILAEFGFKFSDAGGETFNLSGLPLNEGEDCRWKGSQDIRWK
jgi:hypothetical protein